MGRAPRKQAADLQRKRKSTSQSWCLGKGPACLLQHWVFTDRSARSLLTSVHFASPFEGRPRHGALSPVLLGWIQSLELAFFRWGALQNRTPSLQMCFEDQYMCVPYCPGTVISNWSPYLYSVASWSHLIHRQSSVHLTIHVLYTLHMKTQSLELWTPPVIFILSLKDISGFSPVNHFCF